MLRRKNVILQIGDSEISMWDNNNFINLDGMNINLKNKNLYLVVEGERIYVKLLSVPKIKKSKLPDLIKRELKYYLNDINNIVFDYSIMEELSNSYEIIVFCVNSKKLDKLQNVICSSTKIKLVNLIQFMVANYLSKNLHERDYILVFCYSYDLYMVNIVDDKIMENSMVKRFNGNKDTFFKEFNYMIQSYKNINKDKAIKLYFMWFEYNEIIEQIKQTYKCTQLKYDKNEIISSLISFGECMNCLK